MVSSPPTLIGCIENELQFLKTVNYIGVLLRWECLIWFTYVGINNKHTLMVVNWDLPVELDQSAIYKTYLHRIGRSGRLGETVLFWA